jgi:hypothetical protein
MIVGREEVKSFLFDRDVHTIETAKEFLKIQNISMNRQ